MTMNKVQELSNKFEGDILKIQSELKRVQSIKCRLKKQKGKSSYETEMTEVLNYEQLLKEVRQLLDPKEKTVTTYTQEDVNMLDYDETIKAIRSIQSKKTLSRWLTPEEGNNDEYKNACVIEQMLLNHKKEVQPVEDTYIRKTDLVTIIDTIESSGELTQDKIVELLRGLL